jgi:heme O synthase-like polyprenyltransferase
MEKILAILEKIRVLVLNIVSFIAGMLAATKIWVWKCLHTFSSECCVISSGGEAQGRRGTG